MKCPYCDSDDSKVLESRSADEGRRVRRRRECIKCMRRFTTYEYVESNPIIVIKKDGSREMFNRKKIFEGLLKSCEKRPVPVDEIDKVVNNIELNLQNSFEKEVPSKYIGEQIMDALRNLDEVAYIRFASVYRQFKDINTLMDEVKKLVK